MRKVKEQKKADGLTFKMINPDEFDRVTFDVQCDMDHLKQSLKALDGAIGQKNFLTSQDTVTVIDIMMYNELSQVLFMYDQFQQALSMGPSGGEDKFIEDLKNLS